MISGNSHIRAGPGPRSSVHSRRHGRRSNERGYTLFEMLVVLAIFSLVIGLAVPSLRSSTGVIALRQTETILVSAFREARARALATNRQAAVALDLTTNRLSHGLVFSPDDAEVLGDKDLRIEMTTARALVSAESEGAILFFPDGSSSGGRITLQNGNAVRVVEIDWMTGQVRVVADDSGGRDG